MATLVRATAFAAVTSRDFIVFPKRGGRSGNHGTLALNSHHIQLVAGCEEPARRRAGAVFSSMILSFIEPIGSSAFLSCGNSENTWTFTPDTAGVEVWRDGWTAPARGGSISARPG